jgi:uncharacterized RDD family membrane protein YckC
MAIDNSEIAEPELLPNSHPLPSLIPREGRPIQGLRAGIVSRLIANGIDLAVLAAAMVGIYLGINAIRFLWNSRDFQFSSVDRGVTFILAAVLLFLYLTVAWVTAGQTVGDHVLGLRVVSRKGEQIRLHTATVRSLFCVAFPIGILWVAVSPANRSIQDVVLRTSVRYDW